MKFNYLVTLTVAFLLFAIGTQAQNRILIDEDFSDWQQVNPIFNDAVGDGSAIDFKTLWISSDAEYIFLRLELVQEINLQDLNSIRLHIDTDNDLQTEHGAGVIGADFSYYFGERSGVFGFSSPQLIFHDDIGLVTSPTVSSNEFEIAIRRDITLFGQTVFPGDSIKVYVEEFTFMGDHIPEFGGLDYTFDNTLPGNFPLYSIEKTDTSHLRILSYNVLRDGPWDSQRGPAFERVLKAVDPDIIGFQEIYQNSSQQTSDRVASILQNQYAGPWYNAKAGPDIIAVSKYPILGSYAIGNNGAFLIDLGDRELLFFVAHPPCCNNDVGRQQEFDALMAFVRNAKDGTGSLFLTQGTPIAIVGDMNLVGLRRQLATLLSGDIRDNGIFGLPFDPDWDGSDLEDAKPPTTGMPMVFTWYAENSSFSPGRLDYIVYTGSVMELKNSYSLFTPALSSLLLSQFGLQPDDAIIASDHLPVVGDFQLLNTTAVSPEKESMVSMELFPNPVKDHTTIRYELKHPDFVKIELLDATGRLLRVLENEEQQPGNHTLEVNLDRLPPGIYWCNFKAGKHRVNKKIVILK